MKLLRSFRYALVGIWHAINSERNMRIHMVVAGYVLAFSLFFRLSAGQYAILFLLIGSIMTLELLNTALEAVGDAVSRKKNPYIKTVKDVAAGAVLLMALTAVVVAMVLFWQPEAYVRLFSFYCRQPLWLLPVVGYTILGILFICISPRQLLCYFKKKKL